MIAFGRLLLALEILQLQTGAAFKAPNGSHVSNVRRLYDYLMEDYTSFVRPVANSTTVTFLNIFLDSMSIDDLNEKDEAFTLSATMDQHWLDAGLVWNTEDFNEQRKIELPCSDIWLPNVIIRNSKHGIDIPPGPQTAVVNNEGLVNWVAPVKIVTRCHLDLSEFPFDEHVCKVDFGLRTELDLMINMISIGLTYSSEALMGRARSVVKAWTLVKVEMERTEVRYPAFPCCGEEIITNIIYKFTIRRRSTFATHLFVGPSVMLCLVTPVVFLLPPGSGEKMIFGVGVLIADTLLLGELINYIPSVHPNLPLIAKYFLANIVMASLSLAISAIIIGFWDKSTSRMTGPHAFFRLIFLGPVAKIVCVRKVDLISTDETSSGVALEINSEGEDGTESTSGVDPGTDNRRRFMTNYLRNAARSEWRQLAIVFDRLFFVIYCIIIAILTLSFARYI